MERNKQTPAPTARTLRWTASAIALAAALSACGGGSSTPTAVSAAASDAGVPTDLATRGGIVPVARAAVAAGTNLLVNPGFESGMTSWQDWGNTLVVDGAGAAGTLRALRVGTAAGGAAQDVTGLTAGTRYHLSVQARVSDPTETVVIGVNMVDQWGTNVAQEAVRITNTAFALGNLDITAPANAVKAQVYVWKSNGPGYAFVDELAFTQAVASVATGSSTNLVTNNPGFEAALDGWENWGNAAAVTGQSSGGAYSVRVGTGAGGVGNTVSGIASGKTYRVTGQLKVSDASESGFLGLAFLDSFGNHLLEQNVPVRSTSYTTAQLDLVAPPNTSRALVYLWKNAGAGFAYADDIALSATGVTAAPAASPAPAPAP